MNWLSMGITASLLCTLAACTSSGLPSESPEEGHVLKCATIDSTGGGNDPKATDYTLSGREENGVRVGQWIERGRDMLVVGQYADGRKDGAWKVYDHNNRLILERWYDLADDKPYKLNTEALKAAFVAWVELSIGMDARAAREAVFRVIEPGTFTEAFCAKAHVVPISFIVYFDPVTNTVIEGYPVE